jgi:hypothetical protein
MRRGALIAAVFGLALLWAPSASAVTFGSDGCSKSEFEPEFIALTCGDGKVRFETREWVSWSDTEAVGVGVLKHPDKTAPGRCQRIIIACPWVESEATLTFYRPIYCPTNNRRQFMRLRVSAPNDSDPELREIERDFDCSRYSSPSPRNIVRWLSTREAARFMRDALGRKRALSFDGGYNRKVKCNKRVSRIRVRCKMSWIFGDVSVAGKGVIWFTYEGGQTYWNYAYRVRKTNHYCQATGGGNCVETIIVR